MQKSSIPLVLLAMLGSAVVFNLAIDAAPQRPTRKPGTAGRPNPRGGLVASRAGLAKYEPLRGAYLGAALDYSHMPGKGSKVGEMADIMGRWEGQTWRQNAIYVQFFPFPHNDGKFPEWDKDQRWGTAADFANAAAALGAAPMITLEPMNPHVYKDWAPGSPAYEATQAYARKAGEWGKPMFIRFAHEMNGSWYPWSEWNDKNRNQERDPEEDTGFTAADYRAAYRNVASMFRRYAPNAALIWCPNSGLLGGGVRDVFAPFYPGDDVVDWVGLDVYERGWTMPMPGAKLWSGQFAHTITKDAADDPRTPADESVNFYRTYAQGKRKPMMLCETGATLSFRTDIPEPQRAVLNTQWKTGYWNPSEYGWMQSVYGTSAFTEQKISVPIDQRFPLLKGIVWFQIGKREYVSVQKSPPPNRQMVWFENEWTDYRIGGGVTENDNGTLGKKELDLFHKLIANDYFLSNIER
jgi:hypothetical protein